MFRQETKQTSEADRLAYQSERVHYYMYLHIRLKNLTLIKIMYQKGSRKRFKDDLE